MDPFDIWVTYVRMKLHFRSQMEYFRYDGVVNTLTIDAYRKRKDRGLFERIYKKYGDESKQFLLSSFVGLKHNPADLYVYDMLDDTHYEEQWARFRRVSSSLSRTLRHDLIKCLRKAKTLKSAMRPDNGVPILLRMVASYDINIETYVMLNKVIPINETYKRKFEIDPRVQKICSTADSYAPFVQVDEDAIKQIIRDTSAIEKC